MAASTAALENLTMMVNEERESRGGAMSWLEAKIQEITRVQQEPEPCNNIVLSDTDDRGYNVKMGCSENSTLSVHTCKNRARIRCHCFRFLLHLLPAKEA